MSVWVYLENDAGIVVHTGGGPHMEGGTYDALGTTACELNVTYNYSRLYVLAARSILWQDDSAHELFRRGQLANRERAGTILNDLYRITQDGLWAWLGGWTQRSTDATDASAPVLRSQDGPGQEGFYSKLPLEALARELDPGGPHDSPHDYWAPTPTNAARPLYLLARWADEHRAAHWRCSG